METTESRLTMIEEELARYVKAHKRTGSGSIGL